MATKNINFDPVKIISKLWEKCDKYQQQRLTPTGFSVLLKHVELSAKAQAVIDWVDALWADYYARKAAVEGGSTDVSFNFSNNGEMPHSFAECRAEIEAAIAAQ